MKYYMSFILLLSLIWIVLDVFPTSNSNLEKLTKNVANNKITSGYTEMKLFIIHNFNSTSEYTFFSYIFAYSFPSRNLTLGTHRASFR